MKDQNRTKQKTRSSWLKYALRGDETVYELEKLPHNVQVTVLGGHVQPGLHISVHSLGVATVLQQSSQDHQVSID